MESDQGRSGDARGVVKASQLTKRYGSTLAVDNLSFTVEPGVVTGFLGPNGAGKSTTLRLMLELDRGDGVTTFDGLRYRDIPDPLTRVGALLDTGTYHPGRTAIGHLKMLAASAGIASSRAKTVLREVGLKRVADEHPRSFSLGMAQRFGLACALIGDPGILLLDEPSNGLDPQGITWLRAFLKSLAAEGRTVLVSSHLLSEIQLMADAVIVLGRGRLISQGLLDDFVASATKREVRVRTPMVEQFYQIVISAGGSVLGQGKPDELVVTGLRQEQIGDLAFRFQIPIHGLQSTVATLEDAFLEATERSQEFVGTSRSDRGDMS